MHPSGQGRRRCVGGCSYFGNVMLPTICGQTPVVSPGVFEVPKSGGCHCKICMDKSAGVNAGTGDA
jgi:hypothetical protein